MSQSKTPNDIEAFIRRTDIETQHLRTRSPAATVYIPHITLLPGKNYTTPPNKKYEEAMSKALEKNQHHLQEEITAEVVPSYQDLDQRLTTVEKKLNTISESSAQGGGLTDNEKAAFWISFGIWMVFFMVMLKLAN